MMELYEVINCFSTVVPKDKGILVLHKSMIEHPKFKVYKIFRYNLYLVKNKKKECILSKEYTENTPMDKIEKIWSQKDKDFLTEFASFITSEEFKQYVQ